MTIKMMIFQDHPPTKERERNPRHPINQQHNEKKNLEEAIKGRKGQHEEEKEEEKERERGEKKRE